MDDNTQAPRVTVERRKRIKYKGQSMTWRKLFIGMMLLSVLLAYLLLSALNGNRTLQHEAYGSNTLTGVIK